MSNIGGVRFEKIFSDFEGKKSLGKDLRLGEGNNLHTKSLKLPGIGSEARRLRNEKKMAARDFIEKSIDKQWSDGGFTQKGKGKEVLAKAGIKEGAAITVGDLKLIQAELVSAILRQAKADNDSKPANRVARGQQEKVDAINLSRKNAVDGFANSGLHGMVEPGVQWKLSEAGAGGVIFCKDKAGKTIPAVLKFETADVSARAERLQGLVEEMRGLKGMPFTLPNRAFVSLPGGSSERRALESKLDEMAAIAALAVHDGTRGDAEKIGSRKDGEASGFYKSLNNSGGVVKYELVTESRQISELDGQRKRELALSEQFNRDLGRILVVGAFCGVKDHVAFNYDYNNVGVEPTTNFSNLMISRDGVINLIDLDVSQAEADSEAPVGIPARDLDEIFSKSIDWIFDLTQSPESLQQGANLLYRQVNAVLSPSDTIPFALLGKEMFGDGGGGDAFQKSSDNINFSREEVKMAMVQQMEGVLDGLEFLADNRGVLASMAARNGYHQDYQQLLDDMAARLDSSKIANAHLVLAEYKYGHVKV